MKLDIPPLCGFRYSILLLSKSKLTENLHVRNIKLFEMNNNLFPVELFYTLFVPHKSFCSVYFDSLVFRRLTSVIEHFQFRWRRSHPLFEIYFMDSRDLFAFVRFHDNNGVVFCFDSASIVLNLCPGQFIIKI